MAIKTVRYVYEEPIGDIQEVQVALGTVNLSQLGEHAKLRRQFQLHVDSLAGGTVSKMTDDQMAEISPDVSVFSGVWGRWAGIKVSVRGIKVRLVGEDSLMDGDLGLLGWDTLDGVKTIPIDLFDALDIAAVQVNPRVFGRYIEDGADPKARTVGVISTN